MTGGSAVQLADAIRQQAVQAGTSTPAVRGSDWRQAIVQTVNSDGTILTTDGITARRLESYTGPKVGDKIVVTISGSGNWLALARTASAAAALGVPAHAYKAAHTDRAATTTFTDDPDLRLPLDAAAVYRIEFWLQYAAIDLVSGSPAGRFKTQWSAPAGATGVRSAVGPDQGTILSSGSAGGTGRWGVHNLTTAAVYGDRDSSTNQCLAIEVGTVFTTSAGMLALQWSQSVSNAAPTRLAQGSYMRVTRLA